MAKSCALPKGTFPVKFKVKSVVHALELARELIRPFRHWTIGELAAKDFNPENEDFETGLDPKDAKAEAFCALGALRRVNTKYGTQAEEFLKIAAFEVDNDAKFEEGDRTDIQNIFNVNDYARDKETHSQVLKMFRRAIVLAKRAEVKKGR